MRLGWLVLDDTCSISLGVSALRNCGQNAWMWELCTKSAAQSINMQWFFVWIHNDSIVLHTHLFTRLYDLLSRNCRKEVLLPYRKISIAITQTRHLNKKQHIQTQHVDHMSRRSKAYGPRRDVRGWFVSRMVHGAAYRSFRPSGAWKHIHEQDSHTELLTFECICAFAVNVQLLKIWRC